ncbi:MAG: inosine/xanthosine triphosphatase [Melioribacteraceae bacterium]|nr:inosine/xanthosine triphosphatase [Melioribacteraceae bacterium]
MKIIVGSENPVKLAAVKEAFQNYYNDVEVIGLKIPSGVPDQPINDETLKGAQNRAETLKEMNKTENLNADFFIGVEGGIVYQFGRWFAFGGMCLIDKFNRKSFGTSAHFELPAEVTKRLLNREELGFVMDEIMRQKNTKQKMGAIGYFTNGVMERKDLYIPGIISALVPFNHPEMYFRDEHNDN